MKKKKCRCTTRVDGAPKVQYGSKAAAQWEATKPGRKTLRVYRCPTREDIWHVARTDRKRSAAGFPKRGTT